MSSAALSPVLASTYVALGGAVGAVARYQLGRAVASLAGPHSGFPWPTLTVNVIGSLAMGVLLGWLARSELPAQTGETMRLLLGIGLLGGFTTFSAFSAEMVTLVHRGHLLQAVLYGGGSLVAGMAAFLIGLVAIQSAT